MKVIAVDGKWAIVSPYGLSKIRYSARDLAELIANRVSRNMGVAMIED